MATFIDWPSQFMYQPRRVTDEPVAVEARKQSREDALRTPEQRVTVNPFTNAPLVPLGGAAGAGVPSKRARPRTSVAPRRPDEDRRPNLPDIGNREVTPGGVEVGVTNIPGGTESTRRLRLPNPLAGLNFDRPAPDTNQTFAEPGAAGQGPLGRFARTLLDRQGGRADYINPVTGRPQPVISAAGNSPGPRFAPDPRQNPDTGTRIGDPGFELRPDTRTQAQKDQEMDNLRAWKRGVIADQRRAAKTKRDQYLNEKRSQVYAAWSQPNVPRTPTFDTLKEDAVPFVTREEQKLWKGAGINMPYGFQGPEYTTNLFSAQPGNRTQGAGSRVSQMSLAELERLRQTGMRMGLYNPNTFQNFPTATLTDIVVYGQLQATVNESDFQNVEQLMEFALKDPAFSGGGGSGSGSSGGGASGPQNRVDRIFNKTSVDQGRALLRQTMRELLGREPTDSEVKTYVAALNKQEAKTPQVVSTTYSAGGTTATQKTLSEAPVPDEVLRAEAEGANDDEIAQYKATGFMGTLDEMLGGL